ncbi:hypothetical protein ACIQRK_36990 [Streptomyces anulatus]
MTLLWAPLRSPSGVDRVTGGPRAKAYTGGECPPRARADDAADDQG